MAEPIRADGRIANQLRPLRFQNHIAPHAAGSTLVEWGNTRIICGVTVEEAERQLIVMTLEHTHGNKTRAAETLGISLKTLHNKLNRLRLRPEKGSGLKS